MKLKLLLLLFEVVQRVYFEKFDRIVCRWLDDPFLLETTR